jgi:hypothetical protein
MPQLKTNGHLDPDTLAALAAKALSQREALSIFAHLAECDRCRDCLRVHLQLEDFAWMTPQAPQRKLRRLRAPDVSLRAAAGIACAVLTLWIVTLGHPMKTVTATPEPQVKKVNLAAIPPRLTDSAVSSQPWQTHRRPLRRQTLRPVELRNFAFAFETNAANPQSGLHGPLASARLYSTVSFAPISSPAPGNNRIAVRTALGERWIALDISGSPATVRP